MFAAMGALVDVTTGNDGLKATDARVMEERHRRAHGSLSARKRKIIDDWSKIKT